MKWTAQRVHMTHSFITLLHKLISKQREKYREREDQMLPKKTMQKTKKLFLKSLQNLKNFLFGSYENKTRTLFLNPLSCTSINQRTHHLDHIYPEFSTSDHDDLDNSNDCSMKHIIRTDADYCAEKRAIIASSITGEMNHEAGKNPVKIQSSDSTTGSFRHTGTGTGSYMLAQKLKEFDMMDVGDVDHTLDVEEALHYYSRLTCPEYVDMVNKFFIDMYTDFKSPQPSISKSSSRRLGPLTPESSIRISSSSNRIESELTRQSSVRISSSSRRLDSAVTTPQPSIRLNSSSRRLGPLTLCLD